MALLGGVSPNPNLVNVSVHEIENFVDGRLCIKFGATRLVLGLHDCSKPL